MPAQSIASIMKMQPSSAQVSGNRHGPRGLYRLGSPSSPRKWPERYGKLPLTDRTGPSGTTGKRQWSTMKVSRKAGRKNGEKLQVGGPAQLRQRVGRGGGRRGR